MNPHRSVIDHVLTLVAESPLADELVLRGSVAMPAWVGAHAREPHDLDWVARQPFVTTQDRWWPNPRHRTYLPPEGLRWMRDADRGLMDDGEPLFQRLLALVESHPWTADGVRLDPDAAGWETGFAIDEDAWEPDDVEGYEVAGARVRIPFDGGELQIDVAHDETLPEPPVPLAIQRADGTPIALWAASAPLSPAWKLRWLATDHAGRGAGDGKDLYDAVLPAELPDMHLTPRLRRLPGIAGLVPSDVRTWTVTPHPCLPGDPAPWRDRLAVALEPLLTA